MSNTLASKPRPSGNPKVRQTVLAKPPDWCSSGADPRPQKCQKLDVSISSTITPNGASSSHARRPALHSSIFEPEIQMIEPLRASLNRRNPASNDAEIIDLGASDDDLGNSNLYRMSNALGSKFLTSGNPNVRKTVLAEPPDWCSPGADSRPQKRQKLDANISSTITSNDASSSHARRPALRNSIFEPDIQLIEPLRATLNRRNPAPNDAEIIDLGTSSDDLGERVPRAAESSSPDPTCLLSRRHPFETRPTVHSLLAPNKGKGRAKEPAEPVEGSEEGEDIEEFTPPPPTSQPLKESRGIPTYIVHDHKRFFESAPPSLPPATRRLMEKWMNPVDSTTGTVISKMKKKEKVSAR